MEQKKLRRIDPEPFSIIGAVAGVIGAATGVVALWRNIYVPLPSRVRTQLLYQIRDLDNTTRHLGSDLERLERIFERSEMPGSRYIRLGNGALLSQEDFAVYQDISNAIFERLRQINNVTLKIEKLTLNLPEVDVMSSSIQVSDLTANLEELFRTLDLSHEQAWGTLKESIRLIEDLCDDLRIELRA